MAEQQATSPSKQPTLESTVTNEPQPSSPEKPSPQPLSQQFPSPQPEPHFGNFLQQHEHLEAEPPSPTLKPVSVLQPPVLTEETPVPPVLTVSQPTQTKQTTVTQAPPQPPTKQELAVGGVDNRPGSSGSLEVEKGSVDDGERKEPEVPAPPGKDPEPEPEVQDETRSRHLSELMSMAYKERKELNRTDFQVLCKRRIQYYEKHAAVLDNCTFQLLSKIKETNEFVPCVFKYYNQLSETYKSFHEHLKKMSAFKWIDPDKDSKKAPDNRLNWSKEINKGIKSMLELKQQTSGKMKAMEVSLTSSLAGTLEKSLQDYNKRLEHQQKIMDKQKGRYRETEDEVAKKVKKVNKLVAEEQPEGKDRKDLLVAELQTFTEFAHAKKQLTEWGNALMNWWGEVINAEKILVCEIKRSMLNLLDLFGQLHGLTEKQKATEKYWKQLNVEDDVNKKFSTSQILPPAQLDFFKMTLVSMYDRNGPEFTFQDWNLFIGLSSQDKAMGDRRALIPSLLLKKFDCELLDSEGRPRLRIVAACTVDEFLVLFDEKELTLLNKMQLRRLLNTRKSDYEVGVNQKIEGFIMDSWNRETLRFKNADTAEEFMFFTEKSPDVKKEYVK